MKRFMDVDVNVAARQRINRLFDDFDNVLVAFSGGKDSGVCLNLAYEIASERGELNKLAFYYEDYEANFQHTHDYVARAFDAFEGVSRRYWLCLPISAANSASMYQHRWVPWNPDEEDIWVRPMPKHPAVINIENVPFDFEVGTSGFDLRVMFSKWFAKQHGSTAVIVGLRADESLTRLGIITSQHRAHMHDNLRWTKRVDENTFNAYPIYDWKVDDIWVANARFGWDYNKIYDLYYLAGLSVHQMRVASPFHHAGQDNLKLYRVIDPNSWGKMIARVNGANFTAIYGGTAAMGWREINKPKHFTWQEYARFLMDTLPETTRLRLESHLERIQQTWETEGYGRNPKVIATMEDEGILIERTGEDDPKCTKPGFYEIVKIKSGIPDETSIPMFRKVPSWKAVCVCILKNDFTLQYLGVSRTKKEIAARNRAIKTWENAL